MLGTLDIKLATCDDAVAISRMSAALIEQGLTPAWSATRIVRHILNKENVVLVAKADTQMMGFALMEFGDDTAHLNLFAVSTLARRCGVGRRMLEWLHETATTAGTFLISLELRAENSTAFKFYSAMGYCQSGYLPRYYSSKEDAIRMLRNLTVQPANDSSQARTLDHP